MSDPRVEALRSERAQIVDAINAAYWRFTRCKRSKPPTPSTMPAEFARRLVIDRVLRRLARSERRATAILGHARDQAAAMGVGCGG